MINATETIVELAKIGINATDINLYIQTYKAGPTTILNLSKVVGLPRTTVHHAIQRLVEKGLIFEVQNKKQRLITAQPPETLINLLDYKKNELELSIKELESNKNKFKEVINFIKNIPIEASSISQNVLYYEGQNNIFNLYREIFMSKEVRAYANAIWFTNKMPELSALLQDRCNLGLLEVWNLFVDYPENQKLISEQKDMPYFHHKLLPYSQDIENIDYSIFNNKIAIIEGKENPKAIVIEDPTLYKHAKGLFDIFWNLLP